MKNGAILRLVEIHGGRRISVFGSVFCPNNRGDSGVDVLVEFDEGKTLFDLIGLKPDLQDLLGAKVDFVTPNGFPYSRDRALRQHGSVPVSILLGQLTKRNKSYATPLSGGLDRKPTLLHGLRRVNHGQPIITPPVDGSRSTTLSRRRFPATTG